MIVESPYQAAIDQFPKLRQSRLATFDRCALSSKLSEDYEAGWSSHPQARGQIFHRWAARALGEMFKLSKLHNEPVRSLPTDTAIALLHEILYMDDVDVECPSCGGVIVERAGGVITCVRGHQHSSDLVNLPEEMIKDLRWVVVKFAHENAFDIENLVDIEKRLSAVIEYPDGLGGHVDRILTGQVDAMFVTPDDEELIILDWKDTWDLPAPTELGFDGYFQQRMYAWLAFKQPEFQGVQRVTTRECYVRRSVFREATIYRTDMPDVEASLSALVKRFDRAWAEKMFPPSPGRHCQMCPRPAACPIFPGVRKNGGHITDKETAARIAAELKVAEAVVKNHKQQLAAWTSVHGPQEISSHKGKRGYGHREIKRTSRPERQELEAALSVSGGVLTKEDLARLYKTTKGTRFEEHTLSEIEPTADDAGLLAALEASLKQVEEG